MHKISLYLINLQNQLISTESTLRIILITVPLSPISITTMLLIEILTTYCFAIESVDGYIVFRSYAEANKHVNERRMTMGYSELYNDSLTPNKLSFDRLTVIRR